MRQFGDIGLIVARFCAPHYRAELCTCDGTMERDTRIKACSAWRARNECGEPKENRGDKTFAVTMLLLYGPVR